jgi:putative endonuclease
VKYVYILESLDAQHFYIGVTDDLRARLRKHNAGEVSHTSKYGPWRIKTYVAFSDEKQAIAFEKYLKSASGRAFAKKASKPPPPIPPAPHSADRAMPRYRS